MPLTTINCHFLSYNDIETGSFHFPHGLLLTDFLTACCSAVRNSGYGNLADCAANRRSQFCRHLLAKTLFTITQHMQ